MHCVYIIGSKHIINYCGNNNIAIGCHVLPIAEWKEIGKELADKHEYLAEQQSEYLNYIEFIEQFYQGKNV